MSVGLPTFTLLKGIAGSTVYRLDSKTSELYFYNLPITTETTLPVGTLPTASVDDPSPFYLS